MDSKDPLPGPALCLRAERRPRRVGDLEAPGAAAGGALGVAGAAELWAGPRGPRGAQVVKKKMVI